MVKTSLWMISYHLLDSACNIQLISVNLTLCNRRASEINSAWFLPLLARSNVHWCFYDMRLYMFFFDTQACSSCFLEYSLILQTGSCTTLCALPCSGAAAYCRRLLVLGGCIATSTIRQVRMEIAEVLQVLRGGLHHLLGSLPL